MIFNFTAINGGGSATLYTITNTTSGDSGAIDKNEAAEGETVTVTMPSGPSPGKTGYTVTVRSADTQATIYSQSGFSPMETYQFTMPAANVTISMTV